MAQSPHCVPSVLSTGIAGALLAVGLLAACSAQGVNDPRFGQVSEVSTGTASPTETAPLAETAEPAPTADAASSPASLADARVCQTFSGAEPGFHTDYVLPDGSIRSVAGYEGWWNSTAVDEAGAFLDPSEWPEPERSHLRVALILAGTGDVIASYDRTTCRGVTEIAEADLSQLAPESIAVIDAETGELLASF